MRFPSYPEGLPPVQAQVRQVFWSAVRDGRPCGAKAIADAIESTRGSTESALRGLRVKQLIPERHDRSGITPPNWTEMVPEEFLELAGDSGTFTPENTEPDHPIFPPQITPQDVGYPSSDNADRSNLERENRDLREEVDQLRAMLAYTTHAEFGALQGGTMAYHTADYHFHNKGHLLRSFASLADKTCDVIRRFKPRRFIGSVGGDIVQGRGIFKQQELENVLAKTEHQIAAAAWRFHEFDQQIMAALEEADREWIVLQGNHDYSMGDSTCMQFVYACRALGVPMRFVGPRWVQNIADQGTYNVFIQHGYGSSKTSPSPPSLITETLKTLIELGHKGYTGEQQIRRVWHGHVHWRVAGIEHAHDVPFDITGGMHRNDRVNIGNNQRPLGWWMFVSPPGTAEVLQPMAIVPRDSARDEDMSDPQLEARNGEDAWRCLKAIAPTLREMGVADDLLSRISEMQETG